MMGDVILDGGRLVTVIGQLTLCVALGLVGSYVLGRSAARAHRVLLLGLLAGLTLPVLAWQVQRSGLGLFAAKQPPARIEVAPAPTIMPIHLDFVAAVEAPMLPVESINGPALAAEPVAKAHKPIAWGPILIGVWWVAAAAMLIRVALAFAAGVRLIRSATALYCEPIARSLERARRRLGVRRTVSVLASEGVGSPVIWCWRTEPILLVQSGAEEINGSVDWFGMCCHELAHWKRRDHVVGLMGELLVCVLWWHPLIWWSRRRLLKLSEQACDDWVLASGQTGPDYAQSLLDLSGNVQMAFLPTVVGKENTMKKRIHRIVKGRSGNPRVGARWAVMATAVVLCLTIGAALAQRRPAEPEAPRETDRRAELREELQHVRLRLDETRLTIANLEEAGGGESEDARGLREAARQMRERIADLERELGPSEREPADRPRREIDPEQNRELTQERRRLQARVRQIETEIRALGDRGGERAEVLERELHGIRARLQEIESVLEYHGAREPGEPQRRRSADQWERLRNELRDRIAQFERRLRGLRDDQDDEAREINAELRKLRDEMARVEAELRGPERERSREGLGEDQRRRMIQAGEELRERARDIEMELRELGDRHPERSRELQGELRAVHERLRGIERELVGGPRRQAERQAAMARREQITAQIREIERLLAEHPDREDRERLGRRLEELHGALERMEREVPGEPRERPAYGEREVGERGGLEREVQELRGQVNELQGQMRELRALLERLLQEREQRPR